jgi:EAL domain-containing protein (putative c-di-GMP-specific phosphodiesterase class I)
VNVVGAQLRRGAGFAATVKDALADVGLTPERLVVEVTEGVFLGRGSGRVAEELDALHALGVGIALDDFGTGYASLTHLKRFPVGLLKIDRSFVRDMLDDPGDAAIVRAVVGLGRSLGIARRR